MAPLKRSSSIKTASIKSPLKYALLLALGSAHADDQILQRVLVDGSRTNQLGVADAASAGSVTQEELAARTVYRPGEMLEAVPGLVVSQHSGEGKANQFYLRGFNLDHGTDLRTTVDGMPVNQRSHAHGQGWTDLNFLIPELAVRLDYKKGPYSAEEGDFASAGTASVVYANRLLQGVASVSAGQNGYGRALVADSLETQRGSLLYAIEALHNDGPFTNPDEYRKLNAVLRYSEGYANNGFNVSLMAYKADWNSTDQIPLRAVQDGQIGRNDAIDNTDGGKSHRYSLSGAWRRTNDDSASKVNAYIIANQLDLWSNFTYFMDDPVHGDQFAQPDKRVTSGVNASHSWHQHTDTGNTETTIGVQLQNDNIFNGLYSTQARRTLSVTRQDHIVESSAGLYVENNTRWSEALRTVAGARLDSYRFDVRSDLAANSGKANDHLVSPSVSVIYGPWQSAEVYANFGSGFHSNDARGSTITIDPKTGLAADKVQPLVRSRGIEFGARTAWLPGLQTSLSVYRLDFDSELTYAGDAGTTEAGPPSRRYGVEFSNYYKPLKWLSVDLDLAYARARSRGDLEEGSYIPGAIEGTGQLAVTVDDGGPYSGSLKLRYFGPRPLIEDNSVRSSSSMTLNGRLGWKIRKDLRLELEAFNITNRRDSAIDYYYASQLKGEAEPVSDIHFHPIESRSLRATLIKNF
ncbi:TonB-dependent receptor plug domain-containing protein [Pseudoduganella sp. FT25W]|jgi:outer membrane receptor protein involved in Fe transport|uniref:TonB-dependent receptor plug domain-containing protein n=1 Tax=Duganella alba TaxID=2666081 RepID=A0A6L5QLJ6_9BURK|nr:TonB-dependent receptor [Duganella alba]MRX10620.1 TonB-dependent receptor plug domain-containing protein [Duganella alba]MRX15761.1 TonB-dependent receptor plug domain-containing protein [Duganella alba]